MKRRAQSWLPSAILMIASAFGSGTAMAQCADGITTAQWWPAAGLYRQTGGWLNHDWQVVPGVHKPGFMIYGPYETRFGKGLHVAKYYMHVNNNTSDPDTVIGMLRVYTRLGGRILGHRDITRRDFVAANQWQWLNVYFENPCFEQVEATIYWHGGAQMAFGQMYIEKL